MRYTVRHVSRFPYESPITQSVRDARMQPCSDTLQRCLHFPPTTTPASARKMDQDHDGNIVHHFCIPGRHARLTVTAEAFVDCEAPPPLPHRLGPEAWAQVDARTASGQHWEYLAPSTFTPR